MIKYWWIILVGAIFSLSGCQWEDTSEIEATYPISGINAYQGQDVSSLFEINGAPNSVQNLENGDVMWIYYTNYRPIGGSELISYDMPPNNTASTTCTVNVILKNDVVSQVMSNCQ